MSTVKYFEMYYRFLKCSMALLTGVQRIKGICFIIFMVCLLIFLSTLCVAAIGIRVCVIFGSNYTVSMSIWSHDIYYIIGERAKRRDTTRGNK